VTTSRSRLRRSPVSGSGFESRWISTARRDVDGHREPAADRELDAGRFESGDDGAKLFDQVEHDAWILAPQPPAYANFITP
jgi:hypothetical protein